MNPRDIANKSRRLQDLERENRSLTREERREAEAIRLALEEHQAWSQANENLDREREATQRRLDMFCQEEAALLAKKNAKK